MSPLQYLIWPRSPFWPIEYHQAHPDETDEGGGKPAESPAENAAVLKPYLTKCFDRQGAFEESAILEVEQRRHRADLDAKPVPREVVTAIKKMKRWRSGGSAQIPAEYLKALLEADEEYFAEEEYYKALLKPEEGEKSCCMKAIMEIFDDVWTSGSYPGEQNVPEPVHSSPRFVIFEYAKYKMFNLKGGTAC